MPNSPKLRRRRDWLTISRSLAVLLLPLLLVLPVATFAVPKDFPVIPEDGFAVVTRGPMEVVVSQMGDVESANNVILVNKCEWTADLISLVPEGTWVKQGDVVAELDSSQLRETAKQRTIQLVNAEAALRQAEEDLRIQELTNESRLAAAELKDRLARLQYDGYREAEYPQRLHQLESSVALAEEELARAHKQYDFVNSMVKLGYRTPSNRDAERLKLLKAEMDLDRARDQLRILEEFLYERTVTELSALSEETVRELERVKATARAALLSRTVRVQARLRTYEAHRSNLDRLQRSIDACVLRAPADGEVVHGRTSSSRTSKGLEEGDRVRYLQTIAMLPDRNRLKVELRLHESRIRLVEKGHPAVVTVDAARDQTFVGHVSEVSTVPMSGRYPNYDLKEYKVVVSLDVDPQTARQLAPGMSAGVNIIAAQRQDTIRVPIHSVAQVAGRHVTFVRLGDDVQPREVQVGLTSDDTIEVLAGLDEGEQVVLKPRVTCAKRLADLETRYLAGTADDEVWLSWNAAQRR